MTKEQARKILDINKQTYDLIAEDFSDTRNRIWPEMELLVKKYVKPGDRVLDAGCGNGRIVEILEEVEYLGVDGAERLIEEAKKQETRNKKQGRFEFRPGDILELGALDIGKFDVVFMLAVFNHIPSEGLRLKVLGDIKKLLKPGGYLLMTNWNLWRLSKGKNIWNYKLFNKKNLKSKIENLKYREVMTTWQSGDGKRKGELYYRAFTKRELNKLFKQAGFKVLENYYSMGGRKGHWWNGRNIVTVGKYP